MGVVDLQASNMAPTVICESCLAGFFYLVLWRLEALWVVGAEVNWVV